MGAALSAPGCASQRRSSLRASKALAVIDAIDGDVVIANLHELTE
jgi:hypothetical protein